MNFTHLCWIFIDNLIKKYEFLQDPENRVSFRLAFLTNFLQFFSVCRALFTVFSSLIRTTGLILAKLSTTVGVETLSGFNFVQMKGNNFQLENSVRCL